MGYTRHRILTTMRSYVQRAKAQQRELSSESSAGKLDSTMSHDNAQGRYVTLKRCRTMDSKPTRSRPIS